LNGDNGLGNCVPLGGFETLRGDVRIANRNRAPLQNRLKPDVGREDDKSDDSRCLGYFPAHRSDKPRDDDRGEKLIDDEGCPNLRAALRKALRS
jgi:hypothetical protein